MALEIDETKLLKEYCPQDGVPINQKIIRSGLKCLTKKVKETYKNLDILTNFNEETLQNLQDQRKNHCQLKNEHEGIETRLKVIKIKQDRKLRQMKLLAE